MPTTKQEQIGDKTVVTILPKQESSVEITTDSKGVAKLTVKVYAEDPREALDTAVKLYEMGLNKLEAMKIKD